MFLLLNSHLSKQGSCIQIPHGECCRYSSKYAVMPGNCLQGPFKKRNDTDNQVPGLGSLPFTEMIIIFVQMTGAPEEAQHLVLRSCTWEHCQVLQGAFRQWWWQCLTEVTVVMAPASLVSCILQLWELKCGCPNERLSKEALNWRPPSPKEGLDKCQAYGGGLGTDVGPRPVKLLSHLVFPRRIDIDSEHDGCQEKPFNRICLQEQFSSVWHFQKKNCFVFLLAYRKFWLYHE